MTDPSKINDIIQRILNGNQTDKDVESLRQWLNSVGIYVSYFWLAIAKYRQRIYPYYSHSHFLQ
jgi:hypothetical protein